MVFKGLFFFFLLQWRQKWLWVRKSTKKSPYSTMEKKEQVKMFLKTVLVTQNVLHHLTFFHKLSAGTTFLFRTNITSNIWTKCFLIHEKQSFVISIDERESLINNYSWKGYLRSEEFSELHKLLGTLNRSTLKDCVIFSFPLAWKNKKWLFECFVLFQLNDWRKHRIPVIM